MTVDVVVIGGGIVGLASARAIVIARPGADVVVVEKEPAVARHQTGRNSGVIHSGIYYRPGSAKARLVARGRVLLEDLCRDHGIDREYCGKVIVATSPPELVRLAALDGLASAHGIETARLDPDELHRLEPHAAGIAALHLPGTGIVDYGEVARAIGDELAVLGGEVRTSTRVTGLHRAGDVVEVATDTGTIAARSVVNCAGLFSDRVARLDRAARLDAADRPHGTAPPDADEADEADVRITPFRGEYHELVPSAHHLVRNLIYPVPDPSFPFLGVHFTRAIHGGVHAGPNAVLALAREGYRWSDVSPADVAEMVRDPGLRRLARRHWRTGSGEVWRSLSRAALVRALRRLVPDVGPDDLEPAPSGVRAQALRPDGTLVEDFAFAERDRVLHVLNAPSPAATASLAIGEHVAARLPLP